MPWICGGENCKKQPYYALEGDKPKFCFLHKLENHVDVRNKRCEVENCEIRPHYGYDGEAPRFCAMHRAEGMHNLRSRRCKHEGCLKYASCGEPGRTPDYCGTHKSTGMVNLIGRRCYHETCETYASYGTPGTRPRFCAKHKEAGMINLTVKKCEAEGCMTQPSFNYSGQRKARYCSKHRLESMVDVLDRHCAQVGCDRQPIYGNAKEQTGRPMWCPDHRPVGSFDVKTSRCQEPNCLKHPSYGFDTDRVRRRCRQHKTPEMVDVKSPRCEGPGCKKQPCCGMLGTKARFCSEHKLEGMVNLKTRAFRCKYKGPGVGETVASAASAGKSMICNRACRFAFANEPAVFCAKHKLDGMVDVLNPKCKMQDCQEVPTHGYDGEQPSFCVNHMATGMKVIPPQSPNVLHWSPEARRAAATTAREASRLAQERDAGSAKVTPLPLKKIDVFNASEDAAAAIAAAAVKLAAQAAVQSAPPLAPATSLPVLPLPVPMPGTDLSSGPVTAADFALAFSSSGMTIPEESLVASSVTATAPGSIAAPSELPSATMAVPETTTALPLTTITTPTEASFLGNPVSLTPMTPGGGIGSGPGVSTGVGPGLAPATASLPGIDLDRAGNTVTESGPAKKRRRPPAPESVAATVVAAAAIATKAAVAAASDSAEAPMDDAAVPEAGVGAAGEATFDGAVTTTSPMESVPTTNAGEAGVTEPEAEAPGSPSAAPVVAVPTESTEKKCDVTTCVAKATFGHPGPGNTPTHCLTHCEEGMHRLAEDTQGLGSTVGSVKGKRKVVPAPAKGAAEPEALGRGKRLKNKTTASPGAGIMLLAGAVEGHSSTPTKAGAEGGEDGMDEEVEGDANTEAAADK